MSAGLQLTPIALDHEVTPSTDLARLVGDAVAAHGGMGDGDVLVVASKIVAKAEGGAIAGRPGDDVAALRRELTLAQARSVLAETPHVVVVRTGHGLVCANAGIDASNLRDGGVLLLPEEPDRSASALRRALLDRFAIDRLGIVVGDTFGRPWRQGQTDVAIGAAGVRVLRDERGGKDRDGRPLAVTLIALADQLAGAADLVRRKADGVPLVRISGLPVDDVPADTDDVAADLIRPPADDLFPHGRGWLAARLARGEGQREAVREGVPTADELALLRELAAEHDAQLELAADGSHMTATNPVVVGLLLAAILDLGYAARLAEPLPEERRNGHGPPGIIIG